MLRVRRLLRDGVCHESRAGNSTAGVLTFLQQHRGRVNVALGDRGGGYDFRTSGTSPWSR